MTAPTPVIDPSGDFRARAGSAVQIVVTATDADGQSVDFTGRQVFYSFYDRETEAEILTRSAIGDGQAVPLPVISGDDLLSLREAATQLTTSLLIGMYVAEGYVELSEGQVSVLPAPRTLVADASGAAEQAIVAAQLATGDLKVMMRGAPGLTPWQAKSQTLAQYEAEKNQLATAAGEAAGFLAGTEAGAAAGAVSGATAGAEAGAPAGATAGGAAGAEAGATAGTTAGAEAGEVAGAAAGEFFGAAAGEEAGTVAGADAGAVAGATAGQQAGMMAGATAGAAAGAASGATAGTNAVQPAIAMAQQVIEAGAPLLAARDQSVAAAGAATNVYGQIAATAGKTRIAQLLDTSLSSILPLLLDAALTVVVGVDRATGALVARFSSRAGNFGAAARAAVGEAGLGLWRAVDTPAVYPLLVDAAGTVLAGVDRTTGGFIARFSAKLGNFGAAARSSVAEAGLGVWSYFGSSDSVVPVIAGPKNEVLLGYDNGKLRSVGLFAPLPAKAAGVALPAAHRPVLTDWNGLAFDGQSLEIGTDSGPIVSTSQPFASISFAGGPRAGASSDTASTAAIAPLVEVQTGNSGETPCSGAAHRATELALLESGIDPASFVMFAFSGGFGSRSIAELSKGTSRYSAFIGQVRAAKALATAAGKTFAVHAVCWVQGEDDIHTPYATYYAALRQMRLDLEADIRAITEQAAPLAMLMYQTQNGSQARGDATGELGSTARAQFDLCRREPHFYLSTPIWHLPNAPVGSTSIHLSSIGYRRLGEYFGRSYKELVVDGIRPRAFRPLGALARGQTVRVRWEVPVRPMVIDRINLRPVTQNGIVVGDDAGYVPITGQSIENGDTLVLTLSRPLGTGPYVRGALDYLPTGQTFTKAATANLRDSSTEITVIDGVEYPMWRICPHFSLPITILS